MESNKRFSKQAAAEERARRQAEALRFIKEYGAAGVRRQWVNDSLQIVLNQLISQGKLIKFRKTRPATDGSLGFDQVWLRYNFEYVDPAEAVVTTCQSA